MLLQLLVVFVEKHFIILPATMHVILLISIQTCCNTPPLCSLIANNVFQPNMDKFEMVFVLFSIFFCCCFFFFFCYFCLCEIFAIVQSNTSHSHLKLLNDWLVGWLVSWMLACLLVFCWQFLSKMPNNCHSIVWVSDSYTPSQFNSESVCGCGCDCGYDYSDGGCDCDSVR